jgi:hypothetical protein
MGVIQRVREPVRNWPSSVIVMLAFVPSIFSVMNHVAGEAAHLRKLYEVHVQCSTRVSSCRSVGRLREA